MPKRATALLVCLLLTACFENPKLKADTTANFEQSYADMQKSLDAGKRDLLDKALHDITFVEAGMTPSLIAAKLEAVGPGQADLTQWGNQLGSAMVQMMAGPLIKKAQEATETAWQTKKAELVTKWSAAIVDGRTAEEIIEIADDERKKGDTTAKQYLDDALATYQKQLTSAEEALKAEQDAAAKDKQTQDDKKAADGAIVAKVKISDASFRFDPKTYGDPDPVISFTIKNETGIPIKRVTGLVNVQTPGRAVSWITKGLSYEFPGGLENGEQQKLNLVPSMSMEWQKVPQNAIATAITTITVAQIEDASGNRIGELPDDDDMPKLPSFSNDAGDHQGRIQMLQNGVDLLKKKIQEIQDEIAKLPT